MQQPAIRRLPEELLAHTARSIRLNPSEFQFKEEKVEQKIQENSALYALALSNRTCYTIATPVLWESVYLPAEDTEVAALARLKALDQSDQLVAMVRAFTLEIRSSHVSKTILDLLAKLIKKMPRLESLCLLDAGISSPDIIAALCMREESSLKELRMCLGRVEDTDDLSMLQDLKLTHGRLEEVKLVDCGQCPKAYADAISRILSSSAQSIEVLEFRGSDIEQFLGAVRNFPALKYIAVWDDCLTIPCFAGLQPNVETVQLMCANDLLNDIETLQSFRRRFPLLKRLELVLHDQEEVNAERLLNLEEHLIAHAQNLSYLRIHEDTYTEVLGPDQVLQAQTDAIQRWNQYSALETVILGEAGDMWLPRKYTKEEGVFGEWCCDEEDASMGASWV